MMVVMETRLSLKQSGSGSLALLPRRPSAASHARRVRIIGTVRHCKESETTRGMHAAVEEINQSYEQCMCN